MGSTAAGTASKLVPLAIEYIRAVERGAAGQSLARFLHQDVTHYELPNRFNPSGKISDRNGMLATAEHGQKVMRSQKYDILSSVAQDNLVVLELDWVGKLAIPVAGIPAGGEMHARIATLFEFQDELIILQRDYICYDPF